MTEILWRAGDQTKVTIVIPCLEIVIEPPLSFTFDGVTEKLTCFHCYSEEEVENCVKRNIFFVSSQLSFIWNNNFYFQFMNNENGGLLCFFYSIVLSKGFQE